MASRFNPFRESRGRNAKYDCFWSILWLTLILWRYYSTKSLSGFVWLENTDAEVKGSSCSTFNEFLYKSWLLRGSGQLSDLHWRLISVKLRLNSDVKAINFVFSLTSQWLWSKALVFDFGRKRCTYYSICTFRTYISSGRFVWLFGL